MEELTSKPYVIGLDLGGTNSVFGIVDARGDIKATTAIKTGGYSQVDDYVQASVQALQPILEQVGGIGKIKAMGIGAPNANYYKGTIEMAPNLPWAHDTSVPLTILPFGRGRIDFVWESTQEIFEKQHKELKS